MAINKNFLPQKKNILAIFAHPDDESFGPAGTIAKWSKDNNIYLITVTDGRHGLNPNKLSPEDLKETRKKETIKASKILGIKEVKFLDFEDGSLCNNLYHKLSKKIYKFVKLYKPEILITFDPNGLSGHIDHIAVSYVTTYIFQKQNWAKYLFYYCEPKTKTDLVSEYFVYYPPGYCKEQVDHIENIEDVWEIKLKALFCHKTQEKDVKNFLKITKLLPKEEWFRILEKA